VGRFKSCKSESLGLAEAVAFERELLAEVIEAGELFIVLVVMVEVRDDAPVVEGNGFGVEIFIGPFATSLDGVEEPGGSGGNGELGVARGGEDFFNVLLFVRTQFASDAGSLGIVKRVERTDVGGGEFEVVVNGDEELRDATVILDKTRGDVVRVDGLKVVFLYEAGDLVFEVADLDAVSLIAGVDGADETHNDGS